MASETSICNSALTRIGAARITSLTDDSKQARACTASYALMRDEVLRSHPWNSAISRASVASLADAPAFGYDNQFQLPADCLRMLEVYDSRLPWVVEGRCVTRPRPYRSGTCGGRRIRTSGIHCSSLPWLRAWPWSLSRS